VLSKIKNIKQTKNTTALFFKSPRVYLVICHPCKTQSKTPASVNKILEAFSEVNLYEILMMLHN